MLAGTVMLGDLNDFIAPSQACINPLFTEAKAEPTDRRGTAKIQLDSDFGGFLATEPVKPDLIKKGAGNTAKVSLNDCLACSGCVTSAETVLISQQSTEQVLKSLADKDRFKIAVCSFSPQSLASIASHFGLASSLCAYQRLATFMKSIGFDVVIDTTVANDVALVEATEEFLQLYHKSASFCDKSTFVAPPPSTAVSATHQKDAATGVTAELPADNRSAFPILASACPGWVCYAEKTVPEALGFLSSVKSAQQITGVCVKKLLSARNPSIRENEILHVTVMPCYDRKLEASRKDFYWEDVDANEVDCVLATSEVIELLNERGINLSTLAPAPLSGLYGLCETAAPTTTCETASTSIISDVPCEQLLCGVTADGSALVRPIVEEGNSDGLVEHVLRNAAISLISKGRNVSDASSMGGDAAAAAEISAVWSVGKNRDFKELTVTAGDVVLRGAIAYGFRNIQAIIRKMRSSKITYHYVEVMACPSGCVNGGGQAIAKSATGTFVDVEAVKRVENIMHERTPAAPSISVVLLREYVRSLHPRVLETQYHHVPKLEAAAIKW